MAGEGSTIVGLDMRITEELKTMIANGTRKIILDFKHVEHCGSSALGMMIALHKIMVECRGKMVLSHPENIQELLTISHTSSLFTLADDPKVALKLFE